MKTKEQNVETLILETFSPSEEYFRKKNKGDNEDTYSPQEESEPLHY